MKNFSNALSVLMFVSVFCCCGNVTDKETNKEETQESAERFYHGKIDRYDIIMKLSFSGDNPVSGEYYYLSECIPLRLEKTKNDQGGFVPQNKEGFVFDEMGEANKKTGYLSFQLKDNDATINGNWMGMTGNDKLTLTAYEFQPRKDLYKIEWQRHDYTKSDEYGMGFSTTNIDLFDSSGKKTDGIHIHHKMYDHTWDEWKKMMEEADNTGEMYQGLTHFWDTVWSDDHDLLSVYSSTCEIAAREHCYEHYELFDAQENRFLTGEDYLRKDNLKEFEKVFLEKINVLKNGMIKELKEEEGEYSGDLGYDPEMVIENLGYGGDKLNEWDMKSLFLKGDSVVFVYDFGLYFMPVELYIPDDRVYFSKKEIAPFIDPLGPLNYFLTKFFEAGKD